MANNNRGDNTQLIIAAVMAVVILIGWVVMRRHNAVAIAAGDASACWSATCRDAIIARNYERTTGR